MDAKKILEACVDEMCALEKGILIARPDEIILQCGDGYMTRRQLKHIVEQRKAELLSPEEIKRLLDLAQQVITGFDFETYNKNPRYSGSIMRIKVFKNQERSIAVVMDQKTQGGRAVITAYTYKLVYAYFRLLEKLNASTAGKTPTPKDILMG